MDAELVRLNTIAVATRAIAFQLERSPNPYRGHLITRLADLLADGDRVV